MAEIRTYFMVRHLRSESSSYILKYKGGTLVKSGRGLAFWFLPMSSSIAEVPASQCELSFVFHCRTSDFQDITAQGVITFRVVEPLKVAEQVDFTIDLKKGHYLGDPMDKLELSISQLAQQFAGGYMAERSLRTILSAGYTDLRTCMEEGLRDDSSLGGMGLEVLSVRVSSLLPTPDLEKALETPMREKIQQQADEAAFERRALAVEKERAIQENELNNRIELARREEQLITQEGNNAKQRASEKAQADKINVEAQAANLRIEAQSSADANLMRSKAESESIAMIEQAKLDVERERLACYGDLPPNVLMGLAAKELAGNLHTIEHLSLSPELLGPMLQHLMGATTRKLEGRE